MLIYPNINPIAFQLGPLRVHWYGLMYALAFLLIYGLLRYRVRATGQYSLSLLDDLLFAGILGVLIGGRLGYMLFYDWPDLLADPIRLFKVWQGGMSFHGGLIGVVLAVCYVAYRHQHSPWQLADLIVPVVPIGLALGRLGNFINGELVGRVTTMPWGMLFPGGEGLPRHPSQLYEFALEGVLLFVCLFWYSARPRPRGAVLCWFLLGYGAVRCLLECFRQPDPQYGFIAFGWLTMGQLLSAPMLLLGGGGLIWIYWLKSGKKGTSSHQ